MDEIEEVRSKIDIVQFLSEYLPLKRAGRNWRALCPFHSEKTPSFMVSPDLGIYKCFGCGKGGNIFTFLMDFEKMDFGEVLRFLAKRAGVKLFSYRPGQDESEKEKLYQINHLAAEFFHYLLLNHRVGKSALNYILGRGINRESLELFKLGYAPAMGDGLQKFLIDKKGYEPEELEKAGLVISDYDRFRNRLMFPLSDHRGNICGFAGRILPSEQNSEAPKYVNTSETLIYHKSDLLYGLSIAKEAIKKEDGAVIVEGELDVISSYQAGVENAVAIKGSALTENQARLLKRYCDRITLALDTDLAGDLAARRGIEIADSFGFEIRVANFGEYKDPDEAAQKNPQVFKKSLAEAVPVFDFLIDSAFRRFPGETAETKRKIGEETVPILAKISDEIVRAHYVRELAKRLGVEEEAVWEQIRKVQSSLAWPPGQAKFKAQSPQIPNTTYLIPHTHRSRREILEEYLLGLLFQGGKKVLPKESKTIGKLLEVSANKRIMEFLDEYFGQKEKFDLTSFSRGLPEELKEIFSSFMLKDLGGLIEGERREKEIEKTCRELEKLSLQGKREEISRKMKKLEEEGKEEEIAELEKEFKELSGKLK